MTHHVINGLITGLAAVFGGIIIAALLIGPQTTSGSDGDSPVSADPVSIQTPAGVGGVPAEMTASAMRVSVNGVVTDAETGEPLPNVSVFVEADGTTRQSTATGSDGRFELLRVQPEATIVFSRDGYHTVEKPARNGDSHSIALERSALIGRVFGADGSPIHTATVATGDSFVRTDELGEFRLEDPPAGEDVIARAAGYETKVIPRDEFERGFTLEPLSVRGIYATADTIASDGRRGQILDMIDRTELNALVIDVKDNGGHVYYDSQVPLAREIGAVQPVFDVEQVLQELEDRDVYTIARISVFEDPVLAEARPELAIQDTETGEPWQTRQERAWANPYRDEVWDYNVALIQEAVELGFDEVQLSYVHFPTDGPLDRADYGQDHTVDTKQQALRNFLDRAYAVTGPSTVSLSADILSSTLINQVDEKHGQHLVAMGEHLDYILPMLYPAYFAAGSFDVESPSDHPYYVVYQSLMAGMNHLPPSLQASVRPWLQDFSTGPDARYSDVEVREQIDAANDAGTSGWVLWNSENYYHESALEPAE